MPTAKPAAVLLVAGLLLAVLLSATPASGATSANQYLRALQRQTNALPPGAVSKAQLRKLKSNAAHARRVAKRRPCSAVADLARFRRVLRTVKIKSGRRNKRARERVLALGPSSLKASQKLLSDRRTRRCGGGVRPSTLGDPKATILKSDENGLSVRVQLPVLRFVEETGGGRPWTKLVLPKTDSPGAPGTPGIPVVSNTIAVPDGASVNVQTADTDSYTIQGVDVFPNQAEPVDQDEPPPNFFAGPFKQPPFQVDTSAYRSRAPVPAQPADGGILGTARDITVGNLQVAAAQYNPARKSLTVLKSVVVNVTFEGGSKSFSNELGSPWEQPQRTLIESFLNRNIIRLSQREFVRRCGEEMLVISNPATRAAADSFANAKRAQGMRTNVFETGSAEVGTTATSIQAFIRGRLARFFCIRPSYVTIMGDDDLVPTFPGINGIVSDLQYSMQNDTDELPDLAVGRILGNDQTAVQNAVNKIVTYENSPPTGPMLSRATIAAQFQDDNLDGQENRTFIQYAETVRTGLVGRGVAVDRIYDDSPDATPLKFNDGTDLPAELKKPTFAWDGDGADVTAAWNEGRFMVIHRDHGYSDGWGHPGFTTTNVNALTNGSNLPVLLSINCSSGAYDYDETSFASESLVKANGGSVGVFGDTRDSPSWHNTQIAFGFVDAMLPSVLPGEGPGLKQRTGYALNHGKMRLAGLAPPSGPGIVGGDGSTRNELYLWHYFGDPSMQMRGGGSPPFVVDVGAVQAQFTRDVGPSPDPPPYKVNVSGLPAEMNGQTVSLVRNGEVIGKAVVVNGTASIPADFGDGSPRPGELQVAMDPDDGLTATVPVRGVPEPQPPPPGEPANTTMTIDCADGPRGSNNPMTTTGTLGPGLPNTPVTVKYTPPDGGTPFERSATTNVNGQWSHTITPQDETGSGPSADGTWTVEARYAGDADHKASQASCTTLVFDNS